MVSWQPAHTPPALSPGTLHIWRLAHTVQPADLALLDADETARARRMPTEAAREWQATRVCLRKILAGYTGRHPADLRFDANPDGKPQLSGGPEFNLSHTRGQALLAVGVTPVGIDVEPLRLPRNAKQIAARVFDPASQRQLSGLEGDALAMAFTRAWTALEARQKCIGQGIFGQRAAPADTGIKHVEPAENYVACIAWQPPSLAPTVEWLAFPSCQ